MWKEWREQRTVVLTGLLVAALMPFFLMAGLSAASKPLDLNTLAEVLPGLYFFMVWPLFAAAAGAGTVAGELGDGTLGFLLSRPVSRTRVWLVKVALAAAGFLMVVLGSALVNGIVRLAGGQASFGWVSGLWQDVEYSFAAFQFAGATFLLFSASVFFSTLVSRTMTAAAAGLLTTLILVSGILLLWSQIDLIPWLEPQWIALEIFLAGLLVLLASLYLFARGEMLRGRGARRTALLAALFAVAGIGLVTLPLLFASIRLTPEKAMFLHSQLSPRGDAVVATAAAEDGHAPQVWLVHTDGSPFRRLTGRLAFSPAFSPDGGSIAYLSARGVLGMRSREGLELRVIGADGSGDRVVGRLPGSTLAMAFNAPDVLISPAGDRVAVAGDKGPVEVFPLDGGPPVRLELGGTPAEDSWVVGWTPDGSELLLYRPHWRGAGGSMVGAVHLETRQVRVLLDLPHQIYSPRWLGRWVDRARLIGTSMPLVIREPAGLVGEGGEAEDHEFRLELVSLRDGGRRLLARSSCLPDYDAEREGKVMAYSACRADQGPAARVEIHLWDTETGVDRVLGALSGRVLSLAVDPTGDRVAVTQENGVVLVSPDGSVRELAPGGEWSLLGWSGRDRVVLEERYEARIVVAGAVVEGGIREIFP
jgi:ABC-type transport system involved in multi-copper enzyme maturation permease subunit